MGFDPGPAPLASLFFTLGTALYLLFLLIAWHRRGGMTESEEWLVFIQGWTAIPPLSLMATAVVHRALVRRGALDPQRSWMLAFGSAAVLCLCAWALRSCELYPRLLRAVELAVVVAVPAVTLLVVATRVRLGARVGQVVPALTVCLWTLLIVTMTLARPFVRPSSGAAVAAAVVAAAVFFLRRNAGRKAWSRAADAVVLASLPLLIFDPRLPFDVVHHDWFLGTVNAVMQGRTLLVDAFSPYGVLSIEFLVAFFRFGLVPTFYVGLALLITALMVVQAGVVYALLRFLCRSTTVAVAALVVAIVVNVAPGDLTRYPSGGPLRFGLPWLLPLLVVFRTRRPEVGFATRLAEGVVLAVASIWEVQTFLATAAAWGGIVLAEATVAAGALRRRLRPVVWRSAWAGLCTVMIHTGLAASVHHATGQWPRWGYFFDFVRSFSPTGEGWSLFLAPAWGGWIALVTIYLASIFACVYAVVLAPGRPVAARVTVVFSVTLMGIAQLSYYVGLSLFPRLYNVALPATVVAAFWAEQLIAENADLPVGVPRVSAACMLIGAIVFTGSFERPVRDWAGRSSVMVALAAASGEDVPAPMGCPSLSACLRGRYPLQPSTPAALALVHAYAPHAERLGLFLETKATTEVLLLSDRTHVFPVMDAGHDSVSTSNMTRIERAPHGLRAGDVIFVDRDRMDRAVMSRHGIVNGDFFLRRLLGRVCHELRCVPGERRGAVTVMRLQVREARRAALVLQVAG